MNRTLVRLAVALGVFALVGPADAQSQKPMVQLSFKSMKEVLTKLKEVTRTTMEASGQGAMWPLIEGGIDGKIGKEGEKIAGLDTTKPIGFRIMYKAPTGPVPIDGDILLMLPTSDAAKLMNQGLPLLGFASPAAGDGGATSFTLGGAKAHARESNGYVCLTVADADVISTARLPKPSDVVGDAKHDISLSIAPSSIPETALRNLLKMGQALQPPGSPNSMSERDVQQVVDLDSMTFNIDIDSSAGKVLVEGIQAAKSGSALAAVYKGSTPGPVKSSIGLSPTAVFSLVMRGEFVAQSGMFGNVVKGLKSAPNIPSNVASKSVIELLEELAKTDLDDVSMSVSGDGTAILAAAVKSTSAFELKVGEVIDKVGPEIAKDAGDNADKVKEMTKRDAVTISGVKLSRIWIPLGKKARGWAYSIYLGVKDNVVFVAGTMLDSTETIEHALQQKVIDEHDPFTMNLKLKELAEAFLVLDYKGTAAIKMDGKGGDPFKMNFEIPVKDIAELMKAGLADKIKQRFGGVKPGDDDDP